jgi:hemoglobin
MTNVRLSLALFLVACGSTAPAPRQPPPEVAPPPPPVAEVAPPVEPAPPPVPKSLYDRLGGLPAIEAVVGEFVTRTTSDPRIKERFFNTDATQLKKLLVELVCQVSGGPCKYSGRDMTTAHAGMDLVDEEFTALVEDLVAALDKFKVPEQEKSEILGALGPLKPQMVVAPGRLRPLDAAQLAKVTELAGKLDNKAAADLLAAAVIAGQRGQRSYAEQLFTRAELAVGAKPLQLVAATFRTGAPPKIDTALKTAPKDSAPQPKLVGSSEEDAPVKRRAAGSLEGTLLIAGKPLGGMGVVMLTPDRGGKKRTPKQRVIEQRDKLFAPRVMAVPVGSTIAFPNFDTIYHNVFSLSKPRAFDLGLYKDSELREVKFEKPGIVRLGCNIHANMSAYVVVVDAPHYVVVDDDGSFAFKSLAPGNYTVRAWSEKSGEPVVSKLVVKAGANKHAIDLQTTAVAGPSPDKFGTSRAGR